MFSPFRIPSSIEMLSGGTKNETRWKFDLASGFNGKAIVIDLPWRKMLTSRDKEQTYLRDSVFMFCKALRTSPSIKLAVGPPPACAMRPFVKVIMFCYEPHIYLWLGCGTELLWSKNDHLRIISLKCKANYSAPTRQSDFLIYLQFAKLI